MTLSRRQLLRGAGLTAAWIGGGGTRGWVGPEPAHAGDHMAMGKRRPVPLPRPLRAAELPKFVDPLPIPPLAHSTATAPHPGRPGHTVPLYRIAMHEIAVQVHRDVKPTRCWSYGAGMPGPTFDVRAGQALAIEWRNELPANHFLPIDHTLCGADANLPEVRTVVHVHGARVPPESDGAPERWFPPGDAWTAHYPNRQDAATLWYHDHAMGIERLNQYAGLFGAYLLRDAAEDALGLPHGPHEVPLFVFDRILDADGQLHYPTSGVPGSPWVSEVYGDTILVNGKVTPELEVERTAYRFRIYNASNARVLYPSLSGGVPFVQIGSDQGLLPGPVRTAALSLAPAERADVIVDFGALGGQSIVLMSQAFQLMRFRVAPGAVASAWKPPAALRSVPRTPRTAAVKTRTLALDEYQDNEHGMLMLLDGKRWRDPVTEQPELDSVEIWELVNYTGDTHPIHLHLVRFQILDRQKFDIDAFRFEHKMQLIGPPIVPAPVELGWKDTVQAYPESITRIIVRFEGYLGRYVWHCHVLEHAANEMMRPFEIVKPKPRRT